MSDIAYGVALGARDASIRFRGKRFRALSTLNMCRLAPQSTALLTNQGTQRKSGLIVLAAFLALTGQRKLVLSEFLPPVKRGRAGALVELAYRLLLPRAIASVQVMTEWERDAVHARFGVPLSRIAHIPFYYYDDRVAAMPLPYNGARSGVIASGRNSCDWETLFEAAEPSWSLTAVMSFADHSRFQLAAARSEATIRVEIPRSEHDELVGAAALYVLPLFDRSVSAGHVRLMTSATLGIPVVVTDIQGIRGYEHLAVAVVPPGDAAALRTTVSELLAAPERVAERMTEVARAASTRSRSDYLAEIRENLAKATAG